MELADTLILPAAISFTLCLIIASILTTANPSSVIRFTLLNSILISALLTVVTLHKTYLG
jgi:hypothetical protein